MTRWSIGENKLNAADRLQKFLDGIESYITAKNVVPSKFAPEFALADSLGIEQLEKLAQDDCFNFAYHLYQYADHLARERAHCENVSKWCNNSLQSIIAEAIPEMMGEYVKHDTKVATIIRNDELAGRINDWKMTAEGRLENLKSREYNVRRKADILIEKGKRK